MIKDKKILARMADEDLRTPSHDAIMVWLHENILQVVTAISAGFARHPELGNAPIPKEGDITSLWETPVFNSSRYQRSDGQYAGSNNIVGYIDLLAENKGGLMLPPIAFEVKTSIRSIGETIRQINTYRSYSKNTLFCIVSPDDRFREILESQNILFVKAPAVGDSGAQGGLF